MVGRPKSFIENCRWTISLGFDGGKFDWAVFTTDEFLRIRCDFKNFLESGDYEVGKDCRECFNDCYEWLSKVIWKNYLG